MSEWGGGREEQGGKSLVVRWWRGRKVGCWWMWSGRGPPPRLPGLLVMLDVCSVMFAFLCFLLLGCFVVTWCCVLPNMSVWFVLSWVCAGCLGFRCVC